MVFFWLRAFCRFLIRLFNVVFIHGGSFNLTVLLRSGIIESNPLLIVWNKDVFSLHEWAVLSKVGMSTISKYFLTVKRELGLKSLTFTDAVDVP